MKWWQILLIAGLVIFRFTYLDQDAPVYQLTNICQEDEPYYSQGAILKLCKDDGRLVNGFSKSHSEGLDMYNRLITYVSLKVFGNNYWALRIPDVIISLLFILFMFSSFKIIDPDSDLIFLFVMLLFVNFYLFVFSRYNNPQIFSILAITISLWIFIRYGYERPLPLILLGFTAAYSVLFVYILNVFLMMGIGLFILVKAIKQRNFSILIYFVTGCIICLLFFIACLHVVGSSFSLVYNQILNAGSGDNSSVLVKTNNITSALGNIYRAITAITNTGYFRFQLPFLLLALSAAPQLIYKAFSKQEKNGNLALLIILIIFCQLIQNIFVVSYTFKKMLVTIPMIMIYVFLIMNEFDLSWLRKSNLKKWGMATWIVFALGLCLFNYKTNRSPLYWGYKGVGCFETTPAWFDAINISLCIGLVIFLLYSLFYSEKLNRSIIKSVLTITIAFNLIFTFKIFIRNRKYEIRDCLISLKPMLQNKVVVDGFPFTWQMYTNCKPAMHGYPVDFLTSSRTNTLDSMIINRKADFVMEKITPGLNLTGIYSNNQNLDLIKIFRFKCYSYYLYKNIKQ